MNTESNAKPIHRQDADATKPFYWSVWRELWENRSIYVAPSIVAAIILFGSFVASFHLPERRQNALLLDPERQRAAIELPYDIVAMMLIFTAFIVGVFYCLDALHGERRDRSILFWKSLPVSDLTTVLSKAIIPLAVLPVIAFASYGLVSLLPLLGLVRIAKVMENSTDYSIQNTARQALFLPTSREAKYKAKAAIDSFFWRAGDVLAATLVFIGVQFGFAVQHYAAINMACALIWIAIVTMITREHKKLSASPSMIR